MLKSGSSALHAQSAEAAAAPAARVFHTLDALRGLAAIGVVIFHMQQIFLPITVSGGYLAVDLFFMMSGVVLSHAYEVRFRAGMGTFDFMRARLIRLYPLYLLGTLIGILVTTASMFGRNIMGWDPFSLVQACLLALLFLPNLASPPGNQLFPLNIPCWSLFLEVLVNLLFVISWPLLTSRRLIVVSIVTGGAVGWAALNAGHLDQGSTAAGFAVGLLRTVFGFCVGILIARASHARRVQSNLGVLAIVAVVGVAISGAPAAGLRAIWDVACVLLLFPLVVFCGTIIDPGPRLQRIATFLGLTSYAVYVLHSPLSAILNSATRHLGSSLGATGGAPYLGMFVLLALLAGCWIVDRLFDAPVRRYLSRIVPKARA